MIARPLATASALALVAAATTAVPAAADHVQRYYANLQSTNILPASGRADLTLDTTAMSLTVMIQASGLAPNQLHVQHIHGFTDGRDTTTPTLANADADGDGFVELIEGFGLYGGILLHLDDGVGDGTGNFPTAPDGSFSFANTYAVTEDFLSQPLHLREIVIHGAFDPVGVGAGETTALANGFPVNEINGNVSPEYEAFVPALAGAIQPVPVPAAAWMLLAGVGGLAALRRRG